MRLQTGAAAYLDFLEAHSTARGGVLTLTTPKSWSATSHLERRTVLAPARHPTIDRAASRLTLRPLWIVGPKRTSCGDGVAQTDLTSRAPCGTIAAAP